MGSAVRRTRRASCSITRYPKLRAFVSASPDYNVGIFNGVAYRNGARFPLGAYAIYNHKIGRARCSFRVGAQNFYDVINGNSDYRKTSTTGFNTAAQTPNYVYRYVDPAVYTASVTTRF